MNPPRLLRSGRVLLFAAVLIGSAAVREGSAVAGDQAIIWLPTGVAIAGLWLLGLRNWWVIAACTFGQRLLLGYQMPLALPAAFGSTAEAVLGVMVLHRWRFRSSLARLRDVGALLAAAAIAPLGSIFFSWIGRAFFWLDPELPLYSGWDGWWRMNALGVLTVVPVALTWLSSPRRDLTPRTAAGAALAIVGVPALLIAVMTLVPRGITGVMSLNLVLGLVLYVAVRFGVRGAALASALAALAVAVATTNGLGPFLELPHDQRHVALQLFELSFVAIPPALGALLAERQAARARGLRSDELRQSIQAALPDVIYRIRRDGMCLDVSAPDGAESPIPPSELIGRSVFDSFGEDRRALWTGAIARAIARREPATIEYERMIDGRRRYFEARCVPHGADQILAIVRDITDRKCAEGTMAFEAHVLELVATGRASREVLAVIVEGMEALLPGRRCAIIVFDGTRMHVAMAPSLPADFIATLEGSEVEPEAVARGAAVVPGRTEVGNDLAAGPPGAEPHDAGREFDRRACWSVPIGDASGRVLGAFTVYDRLPREADRGERSLGERAAALVGIVLDRENRSHALRRSEDLLASLNRNVKEGLFRVAPDLTIRYVNLAFARMMGFDAPEELVGRSLAGAFEDDRMLAELGQLITERGHWLNEEFPLCRRDGSRFWAMVSGTAVRDTEGRVTHCDGAIADVTARKELEAQFRQSQKMEAVGKLAGGVAHDFNNLLTVILGCADTIRDDVGSQSPIRALAEQVLDAAKRAAGLTRQLLAYSRQQVLSPQVLELNAVVDHMGGMLRRLIGETIRLEIVHRSGPCWVRVDRSQLEQVLLNLVVNARDAMPSGGTLSLTTEIGEADAVPTSAGAELRPGPCVRLRVGDTGSGMPADVRARAFDPFFTTKGPGKGTGLGLSTVYGIVQQSGGAVWLESSPGEGTTVSIALPRVAPSVPHESAAPGPRVPAAEATVLVVEDEPDVRELVRQTLAAGGYRVLEAPDGARAIDLAEAHEGVIDLVVTDLVMPELGGRDMARRLLAERPALRFLFISGYPDDARESNEFVGAAGEFLPKPFLPKQLLERVRAVLHPSVAGAAAPS